MTADQKPQTFANHRAYPPVYMLAGLVLAVDLCRRSWTLIEVRDRAALWSVMIGLALLVIWHTSRRKAQIMQDRIIRLEMRLRLERLLPPDRRASIAQLSVPQLVSLRFASDAELPELVREVLAQNIEKPDDIKRRIKDWQTDWLRV